MQPFSQDPTGKCKAAEGSAPETPQHHSTGSSWWIAYAVLLLEDIILVKPQRVKRVRRQATHTPFYFGIFCQGCYQ